MADGKKRPKKRGEASTQGESAPGSPQSQNSENSENSKTTQTTQTTQATQANQANQANQATQATQNRRQQVRSAQIRHRERKANHQKQLELDAAKFRDMVAQVAAETAAMRRENEAMRAALINGGIRLSAPPIAHPGVRSVAHSVAHSVASTDPSVLDPETQTNHTSPATTPELFSNIDINDLTVTLCVDDQLGGPAFQISSNSPGTSFQSAPSPLPSDAEWPLSRAQEDAAINFILA